MDRDIALENEVRVLQKELGKLIGILRSEKILTDKHMSMIFEEDNTKNCVSCDRFGIDCGTCEVSEDD